MSNEPESRPPAPMMGNGRVRFDWTINFGTVLHLVVLVGALIGLYLSLVERISATERQLAEIGVKVSAVWDRFIRDAGPARPP